MKKIVLITGGFDPLHSGHIAYFKAAKALGDTLVVGVNSDAWLTRKKGSPFLPYKERAEIVRNIVGVDFNSGFVRVGYGPYAAKAVIVVVVSVGAFKHEENFIEAVSIDVFADKIA